MNLKGAATTAKAISAITWAVESTGRFVGKGTKAFVSAVKDHKYYTIDVMVDGATVDNKTRQTKEDIMSMVNSLEHFGKCQIIIGAENND